MVIYRKRLFNFRAIGNILGMVLLIEAMAMIVAMGTCLIYGEADWRCFGICAGICAIAGGSLKGLLKPVRTQLSSHDSILITVVAWLAIVLFGSLPFVLCTHPVGITDAFFESMSGFSTTGASVMPDVETLGKGVNMWRALTQWIGGIGIILFTLTLIPHLDKTGGMRLMAAESSDFAFDKTSPRIMQTARTLAVVYLALTGACIVALWVGPMDFYDSVVHTFSTVSTGGFSPYRDSIMHFDSIYIKFVLIVFMFIGSANFTLFAFASKGDFKPLASNSTIRIYAITILAFALLCMCSMLMVGLPFGFDSSVVDPIFIVTSAISSTGFVSADYELWGALVFVFLLLVMYCGGCMGSTTGGAKIDRMIVFFRNMRNEVRATVNRNTLFTVKDGSRVLQPDAVSRIITFVGLFLFTILIGGILFMAFGLCASDAFFVSCSATSNIGLGYGITGVHGSFAVLPDVGKWLMSVLMFIGRLELLTVFLLFLPSFWRR